MQALLVPSQCGVAEHVSDIILTNEGDFQAVRITKVENNHEKSKFLPYFENFSIKKKRGKNADFF